MNDNNYIKMAQSFTIPEEFLCPISFAIMDDPVTLVDGHTFDRASIEKWFSRGKNTSPLTGLPLSNLSLVSNRSIRGLIKTFKQVFRFELFQVIMEKFHREMMQWEMKFYAAKQHFQKIVYSKNGKYKGNLIDNTEIMSGLGTFEGKIGHIYQGEWLMSKREGKGIYSYENGNKYFGEWRNNLRQGHGIYTYKNGDRYEGQFCKDKRHGLGIMYYKNGKTERMTYLNGKLIIT